MSSTGVKMKMRELRAVTVQSQYRWRVGKLLRTELVGWLRGLDSTLATTFVRCAYAHVSTNEVAELQA